LQRFLVAISSRHHSGRSADGAAPLSYLANQNALEHLNARRDSAVQKLGTDATPTFFVNGERLVGDVTIETAAKEIDPYLKEQ